MAQNYIESSERLDYIVPEGVTIKSGQIVEIGDLVGVSLNDGVEGSIVTITFEGVFELPKVTGSGTGMTQGMSLYFNGEGELTNASDDGGDPTPTEFKFAGWCWKTANTLAETVQCKLAFS